MPTNDNIKQILDYIGLTLSTHTTHQQYAYFLQKDLIQSLIYAFPLISLQFGRGHVLAFETLISKAVIKQAEIEYTEEIHDDILAALNRGRF